MVQYSQQIVRQEPGRQIPLWNTVQREPGQKFQIRLAAPDVQLLPVMLPYVQHESRQVMAFPGQVQSEFHCRLVHPAQNLIRHRPSIRCAMLMIRVVKPVQIVTPFRRSPPRGISLQPVLPPHMNHKRSQRHPIVIRRGRGFQKNLRYRDARYSFITCHRGSCHPDDLTILTDVV